MKFTPPAMSLALLRTVILAVIAGILAILLANVLFGLSEKGQLLSATQERLSAFEQRLARPMVANRYENYSVFLLPGPDEALATTLQNELISIVNAHAGQVVDIREMPAVTTPMGLTALKIHLVLEGDLQAVTETLADIARMDHPILLDRTGIQTIGTTSSPDGSLRASLDLTIWSETSP